MPVQCPRALEAGQSRNVRPGHRGRRPPMNVPGLGPLAAESPCIGSGWRGLRLRLLKLEGAGLAMDWAGRASGRRA